MVTFICRLFYSFGLQWFLEWRSETPHPADGPEEEWEVLHPKGCLPQNVAKWDPVFREHQQDLQGGCIQQLLRQLPDLGLSGPNRLLWPHLRLWNDLQGDWSTHLCHWLTGRPSFQFTYNIKCSYSPVTTFSFYYASLLTGWLCGSSESTASYRHQSLQSQPRHKLWGVHSQSGRSLRWS